MMLTQLFLPLDMPFLPAPRKERFLPRVEAQAPATASEVGDLLASFSGFFRGSRLALADLGQGEAGWEELRPYVALWRAVLIQQVMDAKTVSGDREKRAFKRQAESWLFGGETGGDFETVCDLGMLNAERVRRGIREVSRQGFGWRRPGRKKGKP